MDGHVLAEPVVIADDQTVPRLVGVVFRVLGGEAEAGEGIDRVAAADGQRAVQVDVADEARAGADGERSGEDAVGADEDVVGEVDFALDDRR
jgi:hypothetical protein